MRVLVACEYSGIVRDAFIAAGHTALSCDFEPTERPGPHYQGDIRDVLYGQQWDLMVAHPPCTYLANSGAKWLYEKWTPEEQEINDMLFGTKLPGHSPRWNTERWRLMEEGAAFFRLLWEAPVPRIAVENPIMHRHAIKETGGRATQYVQPWQHGHKESKRTGLRLKNLPKLVPTDVVYDEMMLLPKRERERIHYLSPGPDRWKERSRTFPGIAAAMAQQWGGLPVISQPDSKGTPALVEALL